MRHNAFLLICLFLLGAMIENVSGQTDKSTRPSPPKEVKGKYMGADVAINYSAPSVKGRQIWGDLVPYGKVWRTGANEATTFETNKEIVIQGKTLPAGKYSLFTIPGEKEWTWVFNSVWEQWGAYKYDQSKDVIRVTGIPQGSPVFHEQMAFLVEKDKVTLYWENLSVSF